MIIFVKKLKIDNMINRFLVFKKESYNNSIYNWTKSKKKEVVMSNLFYILCR